jgi:hypothetical protein
MTIKYAYIHPDTREYQYVDTREALQDALAKYAAETYVNHFCNGSPFTVVEVQEDGSEKWYAPTGEQVMTPAEVEAKIKQLESFENAGEIPVSILGSSNAN